MVDFPEELSERVKVSLQSFSGDPAAEQENNIFPSKNYTSCSGVCFRKYHESENAAVENRKLGRAQILRLIGKPCGGKGEAGQGLWSLGLTLRFSKEGLRLGMFLLVERKLFLHKEQIRIQTNESYPNLAEMFDIHHPFDGLNLISGLFHPDKAGVHAVLENKPASLS